MASRFVGQIERVSPNDATTLATDRGPAPMNICAVLTIEHGSELALEEVGALLAARLPRVRRLRQRLVATPPGCGRPVWVDDAAFDLDHHLEKITDGDLLEVAAAVACTPLPRGRPLWAARWVTGLPEGRAALLLVVHHCLADGLGGLAVLAALADEGPPSPSDGDVAASVDPQAFPRAQPPWRALAADAWRARLQGLSRVPQRLVGMRSGVGELRGGSRLDLAPQTSLNRPTGSGRAVSVATVALASLVRAAHTQGCTVNDLVLCAVAGGVGTVIRERGETAEAIVASVPISTRRSTTVERLGNETGVLPLRLPLLVDRQERLRQITALTARARGPRRGASAGPLGLAFRGLASIGAFQLFIDRQRLVNTFVTNVRGPATPLSFGGHEVLAVVPLAITPGNVGVSFDVLSYAGRLVATVVADPEIVPEHAALAQLLEEELLCW